MRLGERHDYIGKTSEKTIVDSILFIFFTLIESVYTNDEHSVLGYSAVVFRFRFGFVTGREENYAPTKVLRPERAPNTIRGQFDQFYL